VVVESKHYGRRPVEILAEPDGLALLVRKREALRNRRAELLIDAHVFELIRRAVGPLGVGLGAEKAGPEKGHGHPNPP
jgi:hypothetical protein